MNTIPIKTRHLHLRIEAALADRLYAESALTGLSMAEIVRQALQLRFSQPVATHPRKRKSKGQ